MDLSSLPLNLGPVATLLLAVFGPGLKKLVVINYCLLGHSFYSTFALLAYSIILTHMIGPS